VKKRVALNFKLFFKSPLLVLGFAAAMAIPHVMMWERTGIIFANRDDYVYSLINYMLLYGAVPFLLTAFLTYEFVKKSKDAGLWESFESLKSTCKVLISQLPVIACAAMAVYGMYLSYGVAAAIHYADQTAVVWQNLLGALALYFLLPCCVAIAMGVLFALKAARPVAYGIFVGWSVVMSPIVGDKIGVVSPKIVFQVRQFLNICNSNERHIDTQYGIMTEGYRYSLVLFWLMLFVCGIVWLLTDQNGRKWIYRAVPMALCVLCCAGWFGKVGYITNDGSATTGNSRMSVNYYSNYEHINGKISPKEADFTVNCMDLDIDIDKQLNGRATLYIANLQNRDSLDFTLQFCYKIHSITDQNGNVLPYTRKALDFITVDISGCDDIQSVTFVYSGVNGQHFAKKQGIALPGNIPYFPIEGWVKCYDGFANNDYPAEKTVPLMSAPRRINLTLTTSTKGVYVSLPQTGKNTYSGMTNGVSIIGGYTTVEPVADSGITAAFPLLIKDFYTRKTDSFVSRMTEIDNMLGTAYMQKLQNMPVILYDSTEMGAANGNLEVIAFADHVVMKGIFTDYTAGSVPAAFAAANKQKAPVGRLLYYYLRDSGQKDDFIRVFGLKQGANLFYIDMDTLAPLFLQAIGYDARTRQVDHEKEAAVLKAMGTYLNDDTDSRTAEELVQSLL